MIGGTTKVITTDALVKRTTPGVDVLGFIAHALDGLAVVGTRLNEPCWCLASDDNCPSCERNAAAAASLRDALVMLTEQSASN